MCVPVGAVRVCACEGSSGGPEVDLGIPSPVGSVAARVLGWGDAAAADAVAELVGREGDRLRVKIIHADGAVYFVAVGLRYALVACARVRVCVGGAAQEGTAEAGTTEAGTAAGTAEAAAQAGAVVNLVMAADVVYPGNFKVWV